MNIKTDGRAFPTSDKLSYCAAVVHMEIMDTKLWIKFG
jgi:hypothetical protein